MAITKEIKRLEKSNVSLSVVVPKEDVRSQYDDMLKEYTKSLQIPGFRKGKVPREVLERKFAEALKGEALSRIIEAAMKEVFDEDSLPRNERPLPYSTPELQEQDIKLDLEEELKFSVVYDVLPEVKIGQWKGLKCEYPYAEAGDEEINKELEEIRERNAIVMDRDDGAKAQSGDVVTVDYLFFEEDGSTPSDIQRKDFTFTIDSGTNYYKFDDEIIGMEKGETKEFEKSFDSEHLDLAGKTRKIQATLTALKEKKLPDLDDDLAQDVDEKFKTLDDLKNNIREKLQKNLDTRLKEKKLNVLLQKIMENTPVVLPESMIKAEVEGRWRRLARYYNIDVQAMMQMADDERSKEWRETAEKALHSRLIIETLMEEQKIEVSDEEAEKEIERIAEANGAGIEEVRKHYDEQAMFYLKEDIREQKITDLLLTENDLKQGKKESYAEFMINNN